MSSLRLTLPVDTKTNLGNLLFRELWEPMTFSKDAQSKPHLRGSQTTSHDFLLVAAFRWAKVRCPIEQISGTWLHIGLSPRTVDTSRGRILLRGISYCCLWVAMAFSATGTPSQPQTTIPFLESGMWGWKKMNSGRALVGSSEEQLGYVGRRQQLLAELCCLSAPCQPYASFLLSEAQARRGRMKREGREELPIILRDALETLCVFLNLWALWSF